MPEGVLYHIVRADKEGTPPIPDMIFIDPAVAAIDAKKLSKLMGEKLLVKPKINGKWRDREQQRFNDNTYRELPWSESRWWRSDAAWAIHRYHYTHPSIERPGWVSYTKSEEDGTLDKQTIVRPGAYLDKYFEHSLNMHGVSKKKLVELFMQDHGPLDIKFAQTEVEIISVYENGPDTCMKGKHWPGDGRNPAYIYAAGDLQVAYLGDLDDASARALVWPEKKIFSRVYGDIARITTALERLGYKWGAPVGARLKKVEVRQVKFDPNQGPPSGCFIAPYIDKKNQRSGGHLSILDKGDHLVICEEGTPGSHHCGLPEGYSGQYVPREDEYPTFTCDRCDTPGFRELKTVYTDEEQGSEESWCNKCIRNGAFRCNYSGEYFAVAEVEMIEVEDNYWNKYYADMYAKRCEKSGVLCNEKNLMQVCIDNKLMLVRREWINEHGGASKSGITNRNFLRSEIIRAYNQECNGVNISKSELKYHAFQCDGCDMNWLLDTRCQPTNDDRLFCLMCRDKKPVPVSLTRQAFELRRDQYSLLIAAE